MSTPTPTVKKQGLGSTISSLFQATYHLIHAVEVTAKTIDDASIVGNKYCDMYLQAQLAELERELQEA